MYRFIGEVCPGTDAVGGSLLWSGDPSSSVGDKTSVDYALAGGDMVIDNLGRSGQRSVDESFDGVFADTSSLGPLRMPWE